MSVDYPTTQSDYTAQPPSSARAADEDLPTAACWRLVEASQVGRLALDGYDGRPDVFPLNFIVHDGNVFIRSARGTKLRTIAKRPSVAFEVDGCDERFYWSVMIRANAHRMDSDAEIEASGILDLSSWSLREKHDFVRLTPIGMTGRRFPRRSRSTANAGAASALMPHV